MGVPAAMGKGNARKELHDLLRAAERAGCTAELAKAGHWKVTVPGRGPVFCSATPRSGKAVTATRVRLRAMGVPL